MTRQERRLLNRTRQTASWMCILCIILGVWLKTKYSDVSYAESEKENAILDLLECQKTNNKLTLKLDSFNRASIKPVDTTPVIKPVVYKPKPIKIDIRFRLQFLDPAAKENENSVVIVEIEEYQSLKYNGGVLWCRNQYR
jgi:hypothetical protein